MPNLELLIDRILTRAFAEADLPARATSAMVAEAEGRLGFALHPLLARLYTEVANGGFGPGPGPGLLPLLGPGHNVVDEYLSLLERSALEKPAVWPAGAVPILDWGCSMRAAVDCHDEMGQVLLFEPNGHGGGACDDCWFLDALSLAAWLEAWLTETAWHSPDLGPHEVTYPQRWSHAAVRLL
ncbi:SMI1/KNR4 family protein [Actinospica durhamensis]|uniref:SMI1/KNR4 family protein n=1 Tax=Actinospica durhamensis TaxID=1508375 RepID=A0A941IVD9_9ACTN|nr:SMI1/KNR4 family protein [Actinospica durhamensis]MBR7836996.1 SMI1/KNR4 family protein [Actinospica durhamensis]